MTHRFKEHIIMCFTFLPATAIDPNFPRLSHFFFELKSAKLVWESNDRFFFPLWKLFRTKKMLLSFAALLNVSFNSSVN